MNLNTSIQHEGILAWDGATAAAIDIRHHIYFSFTFEVLVDLAADTTFEVMAAPPDAADPCIPGAWYKVPTVPRCDERMVADESLITLPAGTLKGNVCKAAIPCRPDAFVQMVGTVGEFGSVRVVAVLSGPK